VINIYSWHNTWSVLAETAPGWFPRRQYLTRSRCRRRRPNPLTSVSPLKQRHPTLPHCFRQPHWTIN